MSEKLRDETAAERAELTREAATLPLPLPENVMRLPSADRRENLRVLEALLFAASEPLDEARLAEHIPEGEDINALIEELPFPDSYPTPGQVQPVCPQSSRSLHFHPGIRAAATGQKILISGGKL